MADEITLRDYADTRFKAIEEATTLARQSMERRLESMNEFRRTLSDQNGLFISRTEHDSKIAAISERLVIVERNLWMAAGGISILLIAVEVVLHLWR